MGASGLITPRMTSEGGRRQGRCAALGHRLEPTPAARTVSISGHRAGPCVGWGCPEGTPGPGWGHSQSTVKTAGSLVFWAMRVFSTRSWFSLKSQVVAGEGVICEPCSGTGAGLQEVSIGQVGASAGPPWTPAGDPGEGQLGRQSWPAPSRPVAGGHGHRASLPRPRGAWTQRF